MFNDYKRGITVKNNNLKPITVGGQFSRAAEFPAPTCCSDIGLPTALPGHNFAHPMIQALCEMFEKLIHSSTTSGVTWCNYVIWKDIGRYLKLPVV